MAKKILTVRLNVTNPETLKNLSNIKTDNNLTCNSDALAFLINNYYKNLETIYHLKQQVF